MDSTKANSQIIVSGKTIGRSKLMRDILYGIGVADALGFPYQFIGREERVRYPVLYVWLCEDSQGRRRSLQPGETGYFSDDTSLALCLAESLASGFDLRDQAQKMLAWLDDGYLSSRDSAFDVGYQTLRSIGKIRAFLKSGQAELLERMMDEQHEDANGNGALMRILPLLLYTYQLDIHEQFRLVSLASGLTHPHIRSALSCLMYLRFAEKLLDGVDKHGAWLSTQNEVTGFIPELELSDHDLQELQRLFHGDIASLNSNPDNYRSPDYLKSVGYVVDNLEAAVWCILKHDNYETTVLAAVNLGDDTDTVAAVAGGLAGIMYGLESIPRRWIDSMKKVKLIDLIVSAWDGNE